MHVIMKQLQVVCYGSHASSSHVACMQAALLDSLYGTERGLAARSEVRAEINELISQLEAKNPNPNPTEVRTKHAPYSLEACSVSILLSYTTSIIISPQHHMA